MVRKKQQGNGAGTVYPGKNKDGKTVAYRGSYWTQTSVGPKRCHVSGRTKTEPVRILRKAMADRDGGLLLDARTLKLAEYLDRRVRYSVRNTVRQRTRERYEQSVRVHLKPTENGT